MNFGELIEIKDIKIKNGNYDDAFLLILYLQERAAQEQNEEVYLDSFVHLSGIFAYKKHMLKGINYYNSSIAAFLVKRWPWLGVITCFGRFVVFTNIKYAII